LLISSNLYPINANDLFDSASSQILLINCFIFIIKSVKVKVNLIFSIEQAAKSQRGSTGITLLFLKLLR